MAVILVKQNTVKLRSKDTRLIRIPRYYGQFSLSLLALTFYGYDPALFLVLSVSCCKVHFHVVLSAL